MTSNKKVEFFILEKTAKLEELAKVEMLEMKIQNELETIKSKLTTTQLDLNNIGNIDDIRRDAQKEYEVYLKNCRFTIKIRRLNKILQKDKYER